MQKPEILNKRKDKIKLSDKPKISVITASFNLAPFIEDTINSVENQSCIEYEHIVIDGASKDGSLDIYKKYPHIRLISEEDTGYPEAFWKGVRMARGEYIIQVPISDCLANKNWLKHCIEILDTNPDISLVWGFRGKLSEQSEVVEASQNYFPNNIALNEEDFFKHWLTTSFVYPEGNLCVRKNVLEKCYPTLEELGEENMLDWLEFSYRFNSLGFLSKNIPLLASFGRVHNNQMGETIGIHGKMKGMYKNYWHKVQNYRTKIILGSLKHEFKDSQNNILNDRIFNKNKFIKDYFFYLTRNIFRINRKYLHLKNYMNYAKKILKK